MKEGTNMKELEIKAERENLPKVIEFIDEQLAGHDVSIKIQTQIEVAVEEIFINIASYAYDADGGAATIRAEVCGDPLAVVLSFIDNGKPYDPLAKPDPNINIPLRERQKGGLGIFMVKKTMDNVAYEYKDGKNILTIIKNI